MGTRAAGSRGVDRDFPLIAPGCIRCDVPNTTGGSMRASRRIVAALLIAVSLVLIVMPRGVQSVPLYAARQGLMCQTCHFDPNGGGPRNEFGFGFAKNRHLL